MAKPYSIHMFQTEAEVDKTKSVYSGRAIFHPHVSDGRWRRQNTKSVRLEYHALARRMSKWTKQRVCVGEYYTLVSLVIQRSQTAGVWQITEAKIGLFTGSIVFRYSHPSDVRRNRRSNKCGHREYRTPSIFSRLVRKKRQTCIVGISYFLHNLQVILPAQSSDVWRLRQNNKCVY